MIEGGGKRAGGASAPEPDSDPRPDRPAAGQEPYAFLEPLVRQPRGQTTERVEKVLRAAIVELAIPPGAFIDKGAVCDRLGVSRFPVSEALSRLAAEGLVEILPQRGSRAARISLPEVVESMMIRRALESMVAEEAARRLPEATFADLAENLDRQDAALARGDKAAFHVEDLAFHDRLVMDLGLARIAAVIEASRANVDRVRRLLSSRLRHSVTLAEHREILAALTARDPVRARSAMEEHLDAVLGELKLFSTMNPESFSG